MNKTFRRITAAALAAITMLTASVSVSAAEDPIEKMTITQKNA